MKIEFLLQKKMERLELFKMMFLLEEPLATLRVADVFDGGLLGIATYILIFLNNHFLYVFYDL